MTNIALDKVKEASLPLAAKPEGPVMSRHPTVGGLPVYDPVTTGGTARRAQLHLRFPTREAGELPWRRPCLFTVFAALGGLRGTYRSSISMCTSYRPEPGF